MKRDMDLVRKILFAMEDEKDRTSYTTGHPVKIDGYSDDQILYHMNIMAQAGLLHIEKVKRTSLNVKGGYSVNPYLTQYSLAWDGHEFLEAARDNKRWEKAKGAMAQAGGFALDVMKQLLVQYLKTELNLQ